jgi:hypothetical protein
MLNKLPALQGANPSDGNGRLRRVRRELQAERRRLLTSLKETRDKLCAADRLSGGADTRDLILAFEIVILIAERETFADMPAERIPVVVCQLQTRLARLQSMLREAFDKGSAHRHAAWHAGADIPGVVLH